MKFAARILEAMPDGTGVVMLDGKMQDDATWKQAKVIVDLARLVADLVSTALVRYFVSGLSTESRPPNLIPPLSPPHYALSYEHDRAR